MTVTRNISSLPSPLDGSLEVPAYLKDHYWWAYVHPMSEKLWDRAWLVNMILWGNYDRLRDAALETVDATQPCRCLQIACAYGDITNRLARRLAKGSTLDVIDIVPEQLAHMRRKLTDPQACRTHVMNAETLEFPDACFDHALLFFLLHEQPESVRRNTLAQALRVVRPGGKITIIDFAKPERFNPIRLWLPVLGFIEPFAWDLWRAPISNWLPENADAYQMEEQRYFGGWFQRVTLTLK